jgi:hypothetical protein
LLEEVQNEVLNNDADEYHRKCLTITGRTPFPGLEIRWLLYVSANRNSKGVATLDRDGG